MSDIKLRGTRPPKYVVIEFVGGEPTESDPDWCLTEAEAWQVADDNTVGDSVWRVFELREVQP